MDQRSPGERGWWRLVLATIAFATWAPPSLIGLPLAGLLLAARPLPASQWRLALLVGAPSALLLLLPQHDWLTGFLRAYIVLVSGAFIVLALVAPTRFLRQALRASVLGLGATLLLARIAEGRDAADLLRWEATRQASRAVRMLVAVRPEAYTVFDPVVQLLGETMPARLVLQAFAGLALAWQWHQQLAVRPLGEPLTPFREFRFADAWVWAVVASVTVWVTPLFVGLKTAALNLLVVLGAFYLLRGAAIVVAFAGFLGVSPVALMVGLAMSAVLVVPLVFILPGLATLGVTDTWLEFRRRLAGRHNVS